MRFVFWIALIAVAMWYFNPFSPDRLSLAEFVERQDNTHIGTSPNVWLRKGFLSAHVALIFGYVDNWDGCQGIADSLNERFPAEGYFCDWTATP